MEWFELIWMVWDTKVGVAWIFSRFLIKNKCQRDIQISVGGHHQISLMFTFGGGGFPRSMLFPYTLRLIAMSCSN